MNIIPIIRIFIQISRGNINTISRVEYTIFSTYNNILLRINHDC